MYKELVFEDFFNDRYQDSLGILERKIGTSLITPKQVVHALPLIDIKDLTHLDLSLSILADIYRIDIPDYTGDIGWYRYYLLCALQKIIKNDESNFIIIRHILLRNNRIAIVGAPWYITEYERDTLLELAQLFKELSIDTDFIIHRYNPIDMEDMHGNPEIFNHQDSDSAIKSAIAFYENNKTITNYKLSQKEYILK